MFVACRISVEQMRDTRMTSEEYPSHRNYLASEVGTMRAITMWNHEDHLSNLQEVHLPPEGTTALNIDDDLHLQHNGTSSQNFGCDLCGIKCTSRNVLNKHLEGRRHLKRFERQGKTFECTLCPITANSQMQLDAHFKSAKHRNRILRLENPRCDTSSKGIWVIVFCVTCIFLNFLLLFKLML